MPEESESNHPAHKLLSAQLSNEVRSEVHDLMSALLDEQITDAQRRQLENLVVADEGVAELCLAVMHLSCSLPVHVLRDEMVSGASDRDAQANPASLMHETLIVPGIREEEVSEDDSDPYITQSPSLPAPGKLKKLSRTWLWGSAAAILLASTMAIWTFRGTGQERHVGQSLENSAQDFETTGRQPMAAAAPATISATVALGPTDSVSVAPGAKLLAGQTVQLSGGAVEVTFASGAIAVIRGPARFEVIDHNTICLDDGSMAAHVPLPARGFRVNSPGLAVIDRGTDFGVLAVPRNGASEAHVFGGSVDVLALNRDGQAVSAPIRAVASQAYRHDSADAAAPASVTFAPESFNRDIASIRKPIVLHSTGDALQAGAADPFWQLVSAPAVLNWKPQQASVISDDQYPDSQNSLEAKWISTDKDRTSVPSGSYVFRTTVDLTGFDPGTVLVEARAAADDWVSDIRVNGVSTALSTELAESHGSFVASTLTIPKTLWRSGVNQVDVVVQNKVMATEGLNATGLQLSWSATGCPLVKR